ncbi:MAG: hypothetical protein DHS20C01_11030 [marine bacterium B5-7]|nr:MAG: hypothetical protein DHS20C01_11030 [marine bacterium B5-7]
MRQAAQQQKRRQCAGECDKRKIVGVAKLHMQMYSEYSVSCQHIQQGIMNRGGCECVGRTGPIP